MLTVFEAQVFVKETPADAHTYTGRKKGRHGRRLSVRERWKKERKKEAVRETVQKIIKFS